MSGWIKLDKETLESLRFKRFARELSRCVTRDVTLSVVCYETLAAGALARFWMYADSHIGEDNRLEATIDEIDEIVGIEGFAKTLPAHWLVVIDSNYVELPDFITHNGTSAKQRKQGAIRQARYRHRNRDASPNDNNASRDASPVTRDDARQKRTDKTEEKDAQARRVPGLDVESWNRWLDYRRSISKALKPASMLEAAKKLAAFGNTQSIVVSHSIGNGYTGLYAPKDIAGKPSGRPSNVPDEREIQDLQERARKIGFRDRSPTESLGGYRTLLEREELALRNRGGGPVRSVPTLVRQ